MGLKTEFERIAPMVVCPLCDKKKCVGRDSCLELKLWIERELEKMEKQNETV